MPSPETSRDRLSGPNAAVPTDPAIRVVRLANGFSAWIRRHRHPRRRVEMWLHVHCGSLNEEQNELGTAHFLEHLAFRGTAHFPPGAAEDFLESLGARIGVDYNAFTSLDQTVYQLSLPEVGEATVRKGLLCLADFAFGMSLLPEQVERERKVILEEMRARKGASQRIRDKIRALELPQSRLVGRHPLGVKGVLEAISAELLRRFYARWYRPDNTTLLVAGDIDPSAMERLVDEYFGGWPGIGKRPAVADPRIVEYREARTAVVSDPELTQAEARVVCVRTDGLPSTVGRFRQRLAASLACRVLNRRLLVLSQDESAPIERVSAVLSDLLGTSTVARAAIAGGSGQALTLLRLLLTELARVERHGFLPDELEQAKSSTLQIARRALERAAGRSSSYLLREMNDAVAGGRPPMSAAQRLELSRPMIAGLEVGEVAAAFGESFCGQCRLVLALLPEGERAEALGEEDLQGMVREVETIQLRPPKPRGRLPRLLPEPPAPGTVVSEREDSALGVFSFTLSSGTRVHLREMDTRKERVFVQLTLAGGRIREREDSHGLTSLAASALQEGASESLDSVAVRDIVGPTSISLWSLVEEDGVRLGMAADDRDLETGMQLLHLLLSQPRIEPAVFRRWRSRIERWRPDLESRLAERALQLLSGGDIRFRLLDVARSRKIKLADAQHWLETLVRKSPVEVAIVGDFERRGALELARRYLGSLDERPVSDPTLDDLRRLHPEPGPLESSVQAADDTSRAAVLTAWRAAPWAQRGDRRAMLMAEWILQRRLIREVREKRGLTYSVSCSYRPSKAYPEGSLFTVAFFAPPRRVEEAVRAARQVVEKLTSRGPAESEMVRCRKHFRHLLDSVWRKPQFWARTLADLEYHGSRSEDLGSLQEHYSSLSASGLKRTLQRYIDESRRLQVISLPEEESAE